MLVRMYYSITAKGQVQYTTVVYLGLKPAIGIALVLSPVEIVKRLTC